VTPVKLGATYCTRATAARNTAPANVMRETTRSR
jgi:hypothetical protein